MKGIIIMIDAKLLRDNFEEFSKRLEKRNKKFDFTQFLELDKKRREIIGVCEDLKAKQNAVSKQIPALKKEGADISSVMQEMKVISEKVKGYDDELKVLEEQIENFLLSLPNLPNEKVPDGADDSANEELRVIGEIPTFDFEPKAHWDLGEELGIIDPTTAAKTTGARFNFYKGMGARLERAIINFMLDMHTQKGYTEVLPPYVVHRRSMQGTGQLPKFEEDAFKLEGTEYFLIPTAEVPVTNMYREQILDGENLPIHHCAYSACFRAEAGSAGRDTRGLIRQHQFNKVELVKFTKPENSYDELEKLTNDAEDILKALGLSYRVVRLCGGDLGFSSAMTYDIEVYMPSYNRYVEISSCSNFEDFQARRASIRYRENSKSKATFVHTLNGSGLAVGRTFAAIVENYQQADGSIVIPKALVPYMGGIEKIEKN